MAAELGLDPEAVTRAANQVSMQRQAKVAEIMGAAPDAAVFRAFEFHLPPDQIRRLEELIREQAGAVVGGSPEAGTLIFQTVDGARIHVYPGRCGANVEVSTDRSEELKGRAVVYGSFVLAFLPLTSANSQQADEGDRSASGWGWHVGAEVSEMGFTQW